MDSRCRPGACSISVLAVLAVLEVLEEVLAVLEMLEVLAEVHCRPRLSLFSMVVEVGLRHAWEPEHQPSGLSRGWPIPKKPCFVLHLQSNAF